ALIRISKPRPYARTRSDVPPGDSALGIFAATLFHPLLHTKNDRIAPRAHPDAVKTQAMTIQSSTLHRSVASLAPPTRFVLVLFLTAGLASAVHLDFGFGVGVKGGPAVTDLLHAAAVASGQQPVLSQGSNYIVGPVAELRLPFGFAIEADGLYRGTEYSVTNPGNLPSTIKSSSCEIPYLATFHFP